MSTWKAVVTEKGEALLAKMTQGSALHITHAEIGAGTVDASLLKQQTSVATMKQTATIEPVGYPEDGMCALPVTITNEGLAAGYAAWQIGIFANDPDEGKVLFFIAQAEDVATSVPAESLMPSYKTQIIFHLEYGPAETVNVDVNPANSVSQEAMENYVNAKVSGFAAANHEHSNRGLSSLVKHAKANKSNNTTSNCTISRNYQYTFPHFANSTGLWVVSADTEFIDVYMPNNNIDGDLNQNRYIKGLKPPLLLMVTELSKERIRVVDVINGNIITSVVGDDGTTYIHTVGNIATNGYTYGTNDLEAGVSPLETGKMYFVYE